MTNHYDEMRVSPDSSQAEELRQRLHARMANISTDDHHGRSDLHLDSDRLEPDKGIVPMTELSPPDTSTTNQRTRRRRVMVAAAAIVVVIAAAGIAIRIEDPSRVAITAPTPTTSRASTTTEQYGSVVSQHSAAIQLWINQSCVDLECSFAQYVHERYLVLRTLLVNFNQALAELPSPPDEIATLVERTKVQLNDAVNHIDQGLTCGPSPQSFLASCADKWSEAEAEAAYKRLPPVFAAWSPYT